jgi:hypothetical protein
MPILPLAHPTMQVHGAFYAAAARRAHAPSMQYQRSVYARAILVLLAHMLKCLCSQGGAVGAAVSAPCGRVNHAPGLHPSLHNKRHFLALQCTSATVRLLRCCMCAQSVVARCKNTQGDCAPCCVCALMLYTLVLNAAMMCAVRSGIAACAGASIELMQPHCG